MYLEDVIMLEMWFQTNNGLSPLHVHRCGGKWLAKHWKVSSSPCAYTTTVPWCNVLWPGFPANTSDCPTRSQLLHHIQPQLLDRACLHPLCAQEHVQIHPQNLCTCHQGRGLRCGGQV